MRRREFIGLVGGAAATWPLGAGAQQSAGVRKRLVIYSPNGSIAVMREGSQNRYFRILFSELRRLGYVEGENLTVERIGKEHDTSDVATVVAEVVRSNPDVIFVNGPGLGFFKRATEKIPIVALTGDLVASGVVQSLAHPGGNITGVSVDAGPSIHGKRIALLREMFPAMSRLGCLALRLQWENTYYEHATRAVSDAAGISIVTSLLEFPPSEAAYRDAIAQILRDGANAIMVLDSPQAFTYRSVITTQIGEAGVPAIYPFSEFVDAGGLMAYSFDLMDLMKQVASDIDAILRGAYPGDIPFYQVSKFELSINLKTAKALGIEVPVTLLGSADKVVE